jgi:hypothetical protein
MKKIKYNTENYDLKEKFKLILGVECLENIHDQNKYEKFSREKDQSTHWPALFYDAARTDWFKKAYKQFLLNEIKPLYKEEIVYQTIPSFRIQLPNNLAVGEWHRDRSYRNAEWAKHVQELNYFLPITSAVNTNTIWVESDEEAESYIPMNAEYGECIQWDASNRLHGNKENIENQTRISLDFRVIELKNYLPSVHGSINTDTKFSVGGYYDVI